ncbi:CAP domain-containing protein [Luteolibacter ambystomatis]|uniref:CAP domain-containing protein n=1 Tax=Luteolibacter ambystomatis TaxID=2824561 RepID=A0A975J0Q6_9BACT|nr:CAP domain-containing protein [Luteolibacter ambystomatis]QUE51890.1 CAP domain-containing protein [Luteolibacter ambystomatis]
MKIATCLPAVVALATGLLVSCAAPPVTKVPVSFSASSADKSLGGQLLANVNSYRAAKGRNALVRNPGLDRMAQEHCEFMRLNRGKFSADGGKNVSHLGFEGRALKARSYLNITTLAENVAVAKTTSMPSFVRMWSNSKGHDYNMSASWTDTGIGVLVDKDGTVFATQLFGTPVLNRMEMADRLHQY